MNWLKNARGLKRISVRELAEMIDKSQVYLKKIEAGDRDLPQDTAASIYEALGFTPEQAPFETQKLIDEVNAFMDEHESEEVALGYITVDKVIYFNSVKNMDDNEDEIFSGDFILLEPFYAELLLESQLVLFG